MMIGNVEIEDTFAEAFKGIYVRFIITADDFKYLKRAAQHISALPSIVIGRTEGGVEKYLKPSETPDGRIGVLVQVWGAYDEKNPEKSIQRFEKELSYRIRQGVLVVPTTRIFNALNSPYRLDMMERVGHCGDGFEEEDVIYGRKVIRIPIMMGEFIIERYLNYDFGVAGVGLWYFCKDVKSAIKVSEKALKAIKTVEGVIAPFNVCSAGSKPETKFPEIGPTTNHLYCPTLKERLGNESKVPPNVNSIPEIVINGMNVDVVMRAIAKGVRAVIGMNGLIKISAANYEGRLGQFKIYLREALSKY